jgi:sec-independent protein translocase protein TatC
MELGKELRWHIFRSAIFLLVITIVIFAFSGFIFNDIIFGPLSNDFWSYRILCKIAQDFCVQDIPVKLINTEIAGQFYLHIKTAFTLGLMASLPYFLWEIWRFIKPALHKDEKSYAQTLLGFGFLLFCLGAMLGYYIIFPITLIFLTGYQVSDDIVNMPSISNYFENLSDTVLWTGVMFELPILAYFLSKLGVISLEFMNTYRKHLYVMILFIAAAITPSPDILSQMIVALPLFILYEVSVIVVARVEKFNSRQS